MKFHKNNEYIFLTYNKVLHSATKQIIETQLRSNTLDSWFGKIYWKTFNEYVPKINNDDNDRFPDYEKIIKNLEHIENNHSSLHIIIDEGQDKPIKFYETLMHFGIENFFIVADQNQQITKENSSRKELSDMLGLDPEEVIELKENYRNSHPIANLAHYFYTDPSSPPPVLPSKSKSGLGIPILYIYNYLQKCMEMILLEADKDTRNLIGVIVANNEMREKFVDGLKKGYIKTDNVKPIISTYSSDNKLSIDFSVGGIVVLNDKSIKGLEFDIVFIVIDGFHIYNNEVDSMKKRFYVMSSRAIKKLILLKNIEYKGNVGQILPENQIILKKIEVSDE